MIPPPIPLTRGITPLTTIQPLKAFTYRDALCNGFGPIIDRSIKKHGRKIQWYLKNPIRLASLEKYGQSGILETKQLEKALASCHYAARTVFSIIVENMVDENGVHNKALSEKIFTIVTSPGKYYDQLCVGIDNLENIVYGLRNQGMACHCYILCHENGDDLKKEPTTINHEFVLDFTTGGGVNIYQGFIGQYSLLDSSSHNKMFRAKDFMNSLRSFLSEEKSYEDFKFLFHGSPQQYKDLFSGKIKLLFVPIIYEAAKAKQTRKNLCYYIIYGLFFFTYIHYKLDHYVPDYRSFFRACLRDR